MEPREMGPRRRPTDKLMRVGTDLSNGICALLATRLGFIDVWPKLTARREWLLQGDDFVRSSARSWPPAAPCAAPDRPYQGRAPNGSSRPIPGIHERPESGTQSIIFRYRDADLTDALTVILH